MKKILLLLIIGAIQFLSPVKGQTCQWAVTTSLPPRSQAVAVKEDHQGNLYFASYTDSMSNRLFTMVQKLDLNQQLIWQKKILGETGISDVEVNAANHPVITGSFTGTINIDGYILFTPPGVTAGFIFETDEAGTIQWLQLLNPLNNDFQPGDLYIAANGNMYLTSEVHGTNGMCAFHKLDGNGIIVKSEFTTNFDNRTFTRILSDDVGNVYISGTCGNAATFDTISADPAFSYQNFLIKYDSTFKAQWFIPREYITFDDNNRLCTDNNHLYWAFDDFSGGSDTVKIIKVDYNGNIITETAGPLALSFFPSLDYGVDKSGNSILLINVFTRFYLFHYDPTFNIVWTDTIFTHTSGFPLHSNLVCYDSSFYIGSIYMSDTLMVDNFQLINPNWNANYPSDVFIGKWHTGSVVNTSDINIIESLSVFPNPADGYFELASKGMSLTGKVRILLFEISGRLAYEHEFVNIQNLKLNSKEFRDGLYVLKLENNDYDVFYAKIIIRH